MILIDMGYTLEGNIYIKQIESYKIAIIPLSDGYTRKITRGSQFVSAKKFSNVDELETDAEFKGILSYLTSLNATIEKKIISSYEVVMQPLKGPEVARQALKEEVIDNNISEVKTTALYGQEVATKPLYGVEINNIK